MILFVVRLLVFDIDDVADKHINILSNINSNKSDLVCVKSEISLLSQEHEEDCC